MSGARRILAGAVLALLACAPSAAHADVFAPLELVSASAQAGGAHQQADEAIFPVISADGTYVAFVGSFAGVQGIWRRNLATGGVEQVAPGDATLPSISATGRYISFTTTERLSVDDTNSSPDVYVRDMTPGAGEPVFKLASAVNGSDEGAQYSFSFRAGSTIEEELEEEGEYGSIAGARSSISADGQQVVFETTAASDLLGGAEPTPPLQVFVRDLASEQTTLVSAEYEPVAGRPANGDDRPVQVQATGEERPYGAIFPGGTNTPVFGDFHAKPLSTSYGQEAWVGASISADGSTVAWMGQDLGEQTRLLAGEQGGEEPVVAEPLWRRVADGPTAPIRRLTGGSDPLAPLCPAGEGVSTPSLLDPCAGPFERYRELNQGLWGSKVRADFAPQLSADGRSVAFITGARELASGEVQFAGAETTDDLYLVDMADGLTRVQALRRLTAIGGGGGTQELIEKSAKIIDYSVSPDGTQVAFTTQRTQFPLAGAPTYVSSPAGAPGMIELYDADLADDTLTRVTHGFEGESRRSEQLPIAERPGVDPYDEQGAYAPSFSQDGDALAFASTANNLVFGDGNGAPDVFLARRIPPTFATVPQYLSSPPPNPSVAPPWRLGVRARSLRDGRVMLDVVVPGLGSLSAAATGQIRVHSTAKSSRRRPARRAAVTITTRTVATAKVTVNPAAEGLVSLTLTLRQGYRSVASGRGLSGSARVTFTSPGRRLLHASVPVRFVRSSAARKSSSRKGSA